MRRDTTVAMQAEAIPRAREPESGVGLAAASPRTLSERLWGIDWSSAVPWTFDGGVTFQSETMEAAAPFIAEHYPRIFGADAERFLQEAMTEAKRRFFQEVDVWVFRDAGVPVGVVVGHPADWSTYYVRSFAVLAPYREAGLCFAYAKQLGEALRAAGCERWEAECSPANTAMVRMFLRLGGLVTATATSERWGQILRFTKFLGEDAERVYRRQFLSVPAFGRDENPK
jgi:hypothetical protein